MSKEAVLFPGQGLQPQEIIGFYEKLKAVEPELVKTQLSLAQDVLNDINGNLEFNIFSSLGDKNSAAFEQTAFVQPLVYSLSLLSIKASNLRPDFVAGHSLGEYAAITVAGATNEEEGTMLVANRGVFMQEACDKNPSKLVSISGLPLEKIETLCSNDNVRIAEVALINAGDLIVVGCAAEVAEDVENRFKNSGASKTAILRTAGAFHTSFMESAAAKLETVMPNFDKPNIPFVSNLSGQLVNGEQFSKDLLIKAMTNPVRWSEVLNTLKGSDVKTFYEAGPGRSMTALNRMNGIPREKTKIVF